MRTPINKFVQVALTGSLLLFGAGCSDFLEEPDKSNFTLENYFTKPEHAESVVNSIYESLQGYPGRWLRRCPLDDA